MQYRFSRQAERDIEEIGDFIAHDNPIRAISFIEELRVRCRQIAEFPRAAPLHPDLGRGVRRVIFRRYLIFYVVHASVLEIRRILHGSRNITANDLR